MNSIYMKDWINGGLKTLLIFGSLLSSYCGFGQCTTVPVEEAVRNGDFELGYLSGSSGKNHTFVTGAPDDFYSDMDFVKKPTYPPDNCKYGMGDSYLVMRAENFFCASTNHVNKTPVGIDYGGDKNFKDHTTGVVGKGYALVVDLANRSSSSKYPGKLPVAWEQTISVFPSETYYFSAWIAAFSAGTAPIMQVTVTPFLASTGLVHAAGVQVLPVSGATSGLMNWSQMSAKWVPTGVYNKVTLTFQFVNVSGGSSGLDVAIDDISFINSCQNLTTARRPAFVSDTVNLCSSSGTVNLNASYTGDPNPSNNTYTWYKGTSAPQTVVSGQTTLNYNSVNSTDSYRVCVNDPDNSCPTSANIVVEKKLKVDVAGNDLCSPVTSSMVANVIPSASSGIYSYAWTGATPNPGNVSSFITNKAGNFSVTVTNPAVSGCSATGSKSITSKLPIAPTNLTYCDGGGVAEALSVGDGKKYTWYSSSSKAALNGTVTNNGTVTTNWTPPTGTTGDQTLYIVSNETTPLTPNPFGPTLGSSAIAGPFSTNITVKDAIRISSARIGLEAWTGGCSGAGATTGSATLNLKNGATVVKSIPLTGLSCGSLGTVNLNLDIVPGTYTLEVVSTGNFLTTAVWSGTATTYSIPNVIDITGYSAHYGGIGSLSIEKSSVCDPMPVIVKSRSCCTKPVITTQPVAATVCEGSTASFTVGFSGTPASTVQKWQKSTDNGVTYTDITSTALTYTTPVVTMADNNALFRAVTVSTPANCTLNSTAVRLTVNPKPTVNAVTTTAICSGGTTSIALASTPAGATFTWVSPVSAPVGAITGGLAKTDVTGPIADVLTNTTTSPATLTYTITAKSSAANGSCVGASRTIVQTVNPKPQVTASTPVAICSGATTNIPLTSAPSTGATFSWGTPVSTPAGAITGGASKSGVSGPIADVLTNTTASSATLRYTVTSTVAGCISNAITIDQTVNPLPVIAAVTPSAICSGSATIITMPNLTSPDVYTWTAPVSTPASSVTGGSAGSSTSGPGGQTLTNASGSSATLTYSVSATVKGCVGLPRLIVQTVNPRPTVNPVTTTAICSGGTTSIALVSTPAGATFTWGTPVSAPAGAIIGGTNKTDVAGPIVDVLSNLTAASATLTYSVTAKSSVANGSCVGAATSIVQTVNSIPSTPTVSNITVCLNSAGGNLTATGTNLKWYTVSSGGTSTTTKAYTTSPVGTTSYYVSQTVNGCESARRKLDVTVTDLPQSPVVANIILCQGATGGTLTAQSLPGHTLNWYGTNATGGTSSSTAPSYTTATIATTSYYVSQTINGCESSRSKIDVIIVGSPVAPTVSNNNSPYCDKGAISLTATSTGAPTGTVYEWTLSDGGKSTSNPFTVASATSTSIVPSTVLAKFTGGGTTCTSTSTPVVVTVKTAPSVVVTGATQTICSGTKMANAAITVSNGSGYSWIGVGTAGVTGFTSTKQSVTTSTGTISETLITGTGAGTVTYTVTPENGTDKAGLTCVGTAQTHVVTINPAPAKPIVTNNNSPYCDKSDVSLTATSLVKGTVIFNELFSEATGQPVTTLNNWNILANNVDLAKYVSDINGNVIDLEGTPAGNAIIESKLSYTLNPGTYMFSFYGKNNSNPNNSMLVEIGSVFSKVFASPLNTTLFTETFTIATTQNVKIKITGQGPEDKGGVFIGDITLASASTIPGTTYEWTLPSGTSTTNPFVVTGSSSTSVFPTGVVAKFTNGGVTCTSASEPVSVIVKAQPTVTVSPATQTVCSGTAMADATVTVTPAGTGFTWLGAGTGASGFSATKQTVSTATGTIKETILTTGSAVSTVTYTITPTNGTDGAGKVCEGPTKTHVVTINPAPVAPTVTGNLKYCDKSDISLTAASTGALTGTTYEWTLSTTTKSTTNPFTATQAVFGSTVPVSVIGIYSNCPSPKTDVNVVINKPAVANLGSATQAICTGATMVGLDITTTNSTKFTWVGAGTGVSGFTSTASVVNGNSGKIQETLTLTGATAQKVTYTVTPENGTDGLGKVCLGKAETHEVTVNPNPTVTAVSDIATICNGKSANLTATGAKDYSWTPTARLGTPTSSTTTASPLTATTYTVNGTDVNGCKNSATVSVGVNPLTKIDVQPSLSGSVCEGSAVGFTLSVGASGTAPLTYQWFKGGQEITSANSSGATTKELKISNVTLADAGDYTVEVTGGCDKVTSNKVTINVNDKTIIQLEPKDVAVCSGGDATFSVDAKGTSLTYEWFKNGSSQGAASATATTFTMNAVTQADDNTKVLVKVNGACGIETSVTSTLKIQAKTSVTNPVAENICRGQNATFVTSVSGTQPITYQWKKGTPGSGSLLAGETSAQLQITNAQDKDLGDYYVDVTSGCGPATSLSAKLTLKKKTEITTNPVGLTLCEGAEAVFDVVAVGEGNLKYEWFFGTQPDLTGTGPTFTKSTIKLSDAGNYNVKVTGECESVSSPAVVLSVNEKARFVLKPQDAETCEGTDLTFTVSASGTAPLTYKWEGGLNDPTSTGPTMTLAKVTKTDHEGSYKVTVSNGCESGATEDFVVKVNLKPVLTNNSEQHCTGTPFIIPLTFNPAASTYTWNRAAVTGITPATGTGTGTITETLSHLDENALEAVYTVTASSDKSCAMEPSTIVVKILSLPKPPVGLTGPVEVCQGQKGVKFSVTDGAGLKWTLTSKNGGAKTGTFTGDDTQEIAIDFDDLADEEVTVSVQAKNACGTHPTILTQKVKVNKKPLAPVLSSVINPVCPDAKGISYSVNAVTGVTFDWKFTKGFDKVITTTLPANAITVDYSKSLPDSSYFERFDSLKITPSNSCGTGPFLNVSIKVLSLPKLVEQKPEMCTGTSTSLIPLTLSFVSPKTIKTVNWSRAAVANITEGANTGSTSSIVETLTNETDKEISVEYVVTGTSNEDCPLEPSTFKLRVKALPLPPVTWLNKKEVVCEGDQNVLYQVQSGTYLNWTLNPESAGKINKVGDSTQVNINFSSTAVSPLTLSIVAKNACGTHPTVLNLPLTMNKVPDAPVVSKLNDAVCPASTLVPYSVTTVPGVVFNWKFQDGTDKTLSSTTGDAVTVDYVKTDANKFVDQTDVLEITPKNDCGFGNKSTINLKVFALPELVSSSPDICTENTTNIGLSFKSPKSIQSISWTRASVSNITPLTGSGSSNPIQEKLDYNSSDDSTTVEYIVDGKSTEGCSLEPTKVSQKVKALPLSPDAIVMSTETFVCQGQERNFDVTVGSGLSWILTPNTAGIVVPKGSDKSISVKFDTASAKLTNVQLEVKASNKCGFGKTSSILPISIDRKPLQPVLDLSVPSFCPDKQKVVLQKTYSVKNTATLSETYKWDFEKNVSNMSLVGSPAASVTLNHVYDVNLSTSEQSNGFIVIPSNRCGEGPSLKVPFKIHAEPKVSLTGGGSSCEGDALKEITIGLERGLSPYTYTLVDSKSTTYPDNTASGTFKFTTSTDGEYSIAKVVDANKCENAEKVGPVKVIEVKLPDNTFGLVSDETCLGTDAEILMRGSEKDSTYEVFINGGSVALEKGTGGDVKFIIPGDKLSAGSNAVIVRVKGCKDQDLTASPTNILVAGKIATINGVKLVCDNQLTGVPQNATSAIGASSYKWTVSKGSVATGQGTLNVSLNLENVITQVGVVPVLSDNTECPNTLGATSIINIKESYKASTLAPVEMICAEDEVVIVVNHLNAEGYIGHDLGEGVLLKKNVNGTNSFSGKFDQGSIDGKEYTVSVQPTHSCNVTVNPIPRIVTKVKVLSRPKAVANLGGEDFIELNEMKPVELNGTESVPSVSHPNYTFSWVPVLDTLKTKVSNSNTLLPISDQKVLENRYVLTITTTNQKSCTSKDSVNVGINVLIKIPNVFSPNGDGLHDKFEVESIEFFPNSIMEIYNQWGDEVYKSSRGYTEKWDGKHNGNDLPVATYYYVLYPNGRNLKPVAGSISIVR